MGGTAQPLSFACSPIPWPEAVVCIFRTTAGCEQAGDLSSAFITTHKMTRESLWSPDWLMESQVPRSRCLFLPPPTCTSAERTHELCRLQLCDSLGLAVMHFSRGKTGSFTVLLAAVWFIPFHKTQERAVLASSQESGSSSDQSILGPSPLHTVLIREDWLPWIWDSTQIAGNTDSRPHKVSAPL